MRGMSFSKKYLNMQMALLINLLNIQNPFLISALYPSKCIDNVVCKVFQHIFVSQRINCTKMIWILIKNYHNHQQCLELGTIVNEITKYFSLHGRGGEGLGDANPGCLGTGGLCDSILEIANSKTPHQKISKSCFSECLC